MPTYYAKCHACGHEWLTSVPTTVLATHEMRYHDGAQTCWTADEEVGRDVASITAMRLEAVRTVECMTCDAPVTTEGWLLCDACHAKLPTVPS